MHGPVAELVQLLDLERLETNLFRGASRDIGSPQVFGGQVLGQALRAAYATVEQREVHSLHAYFLRRGDFKAPIVYEVDRSRDGQSFSSRRVVAIQHGEQIFHMAASFHVREQGVVHQMRMPAAPPPEQLQDLRALVEARSTPVSAAVQRFAGRHAPFEFRLVDPPDLSAPASAQPEQSLWLRAVDDPGDDPCLHRCLLAYVSDHHLIGTALRPHGLTLASPGLMVASIDHAMWFHHPVRVDEWLLYVMDSPAAQDARGFARGSLFNRDGVLVASTAQEGLIRTR